MGFFGNIFGNQDQAEPGFAWNHLTSLAELDELMAASESHPVLVFKHSTRCGVSRMVLRNFESAFDPANGLEPYFLDLLQYRDVSNAVAQRLEVVHQSPQIIVVRNGKAVFAASHENIDARQLKAVY